MCSGSECHEERPVLVLACLCRQTCVSSRHPCHGGGASLLETMAWFDIFAHNMSYSNSFDADEDDTYPRTPFPTSRRSVRDLCRFDVVLTTYGTVSSDMTKHEADVQTLGGSFTTRCGFQLLGPFGFDDSQQGRVA